MAAYLQEVQLIMGWLVCWINRSQIAQIPDFSCGDWSTWWTVR